MQFINGGPDIPNVLLDEHENGKVIFFCGAGISYPAGLPNFKGLVDKIYEKIGDVRSLSEENAYYKDQFDTTLTLLQNRIMVGRKSIFNAIYEILQPCYALPRSIDTQVALLKLSTTRENKTHLITSNFDRVFEKAKEKITKNIKSQVAPSLPIPDDKWDSLVYLHGMLPLVNDKYNKKNDNLITTSGDFGQAYLIQRWAARFVSQIFEKYTVCFVGYSLNDPILRYMTDALAANQDAGYKAYIFADYHNENEEKNKKQEWDIRGIIPIFYKVDNYNHQKLHQTLKKWGDHYEKTPITVRQEIIDRYIRCDPTKSTKEDDFIGRLLWALSDDTGTIAQYFSKKIPLPSLYWLDEFKQYEQENHLSALQYSFTNCIQALFDDSQSPPWTKATGFIADWLIRQINNPEVFKFIINIEKPLALNFKEKIRNTLADISRLKKSNQQDVIEKIKEKYPDATPSDFMYLLWNLLINDHIYIQTFKDHKLWSWKSDFENLGLLPNLIINLRKIISPKIILTGRKFYQDIDLSDRPENWKININNLSFGIDDNFIQIIAKQDQSIDYYLIFLQEFIIAFKSGLNLLQLFKKDAENLYDNESFWLLKSIEPSSQNSYLGASLFDGNRFNSNNSKHAILILILIREFWLQILKKDKQKATKVALSWFDEPYTVFKRLALYAATQDYNILDQVWVSCLLNNNAKYLWSMETKKEKFRVLGKRGNGLNKKWQTKLENAILIGHPDIDVLSKDLIQASSWHHLLTLQSSGAILSSKAQNFINNIKTDHPEWTEPDETNEFPGGYIYPVQSMDSLPKGYIDPTTESEMYQVLLDNVDQFRDDNNRIECWHYHNTWSNYCREHAKNALNILSKLLVEQHFILILWIDFFNATNNPDTLRKIWKSLVGLIQGLSQENIKSIAPICASWLMFSIEDKETVSAEDIDFLPIFKCLYLALHENEDVEQENIQDICNYALNCPIGRLTSALIKFYFKSKPTVNSQIPENIKYYFNQILANTRSNFIYGKVNLSLYLYNFYYIDPQWTKQYLIPLLDWNKNNEAWVIWCGFCFNNRISDELLSEIKTYFIATASHYDDLQKGGRDYGRYYARLLVNVTLYQKNILTDIELRRVYNDMPSETLYQIIEILNVYLSEKQKELKSFWTDSLNPFFAKIWPKSKDKFNDQLVDTFVNFCIQSKEAFPIALQALEDWLMPINVPRLITPLILMGDYKLCSNFPEESLELLSKVIVSNVNSLCYLSKRLQEIKEARPELEEDQRFQTLLMLC